MGEMLNESLKRVSKNRDENLPILCGISLDEGERQCGVMAKAFSEQGASRRTIIKPANIHAKAQYLYEGNQKGDE